jgi:hypothetical protein
MDKKNNVVNLTLIRGGKPRKKGFVATKEEIFELVKYHTKQDIDFEYGFFLTGCTDSTEYGCAVQAKKRINQILELNIMSQEEIQKACDEAYAEYGKLQDPKVWDVFLNGPKEKYEKVHVKLMYQAGPQNWLAYHFWFVRFWYDRVGEQLASYRKRITGHGATIFELCENNQNRAKRNTNDGQT